MDLEAFAAQRRETQALITRLVVDLLDLSVPPRPSVEFVRLGMDSLVAVELRDRLVVELGLGLPMAIAMDHPTVRRLTSAVQEHLSADALAAELDAALDEVLGESGP